MNLKKTVPKLMLISMLLTVLVATAYSSHGAHVDEHWFQTIISRDEKLTALLTHDIDAAPVPYPEALPYLQDAGYTITSNTRLAHTLAMENNRVWPFGGVTNPNPNGWHTGTGSPNDPCYTSATCFRKAIHRLVPKDDCVALYAPLKSNCDWWLPPGQAYWINPAAPGPTYNPTQAVTYLNNGGFTENSAWSNPYYDPDFAWSSPYLRRDPIGPDGVLGTGDDGTIPIEFEYYAIAPVEDTIGFEMAQLITEYFRKAGISVDLVAGTWLGMVMRLVNPVLTDYQFMTGLGMAWDSTAPDVLYDFTYSENVPLWNFAGMNIPTMDAAGLQMMSTLSLTVCRQAAFNIQTLLAQYEPYLPLLLDNGFSAFTGPYDDKPGAIGIVNAEGYGAMGFEDLNVGLLRPPSAQGCNSWGKMLGRANRFDPVRPTVEIDKWALDLYLDTLNPLTADTAADWQVLSLVEDYLFRRNPYTLDYMWWAAETAPVMEEWVGPGREQIGGNAVYDNAYNGTHYAGVGNNALPETPQPDPYPGPFNIVPGGDDVVIAVAQVEAGDLADDDQLGMVTTWTLRDGMYWHDSDPGPDMIFDTADDGVKYPVTAEDARFFFDLIRFQGNERYLSTWRFIHCVEVVDIYTFKVLEERRYPFAFEAHNVALSTPKHIWEPWINPSIIVPPASTHDAGDAEPRQKLDFDEDTYMYLAESDATPTGDSYMLWDDWGGTWSDAEKLPDNTEDDLMCWAASASNVLEWTEWGLVSGMTTTDQMFQHFQDHWTDEGSLQEYAWNWWFDGTEIVPGPGWSHVDVPGGGNFWSEYTFADYYDEEWLDSQALVAIDNFLHNGKGTGLAIYTDAGGGHAITCWGYNYNPSDPTDYYGVWVTDSDDDKHLSNPPDTLRYYEVLYDSGKSRWHLQNYYGSNDWYIGGVMALARAGAPGAELVCILPDGTLTYGNIWISWERHHEEWFGWEEEYRDWAGEGTDNDCPIHPGYSLTKLIGFGPFHYHYGGWEPGVSTHVESNTAYFARHICQGDVDFDQVVDLADLFIITSSFGQYGAPNYQVRADICYPPQVVDLNEVYTVLFIHFGHYWGPDPVPEGFVPCPGC